VGYAGGAYRAPVLMSNIGVAVGVNILDDFNIKHYDIEYTTTAYDKGTIEVFYADGPSMLERELDETQRNA
jgi:hypothetical protein